MRGWIFAVFGTLCLLGVPATAVAGTAEFELHFACKETSGEAMRVRIHQGGAVVHDATATLPHGACGHPGTLSGMPVFRVDDRAGFEVELMAVGAARMRLREVRVVYKDFTQASGVEGGRGYCLSTDPSDSFGDDHQREPCEASKTFEFAIPPARPLTTVVSIDCHKPGLKNTQTADAMTVDVSGPPHEAGGSQALPLATCDERPLTRTVVLGNGGRPSAPAVSARVRFSIAGDDAAWLDWVSLTLRRRPEPLSVPGPLGSDGVSTCLGGEGVATWAGGTYRCQPTITLSAPAPTWQ